jgi:hypothetical protein
MVGQIAVAVEVRQFHRIRVDQAESACAHSHQRVRQQAAVAPATHEEVVQLAQALPSMLTQRAGGARPAFRVGEWFRECPCAEFGQSGRNQAQGHRHLLPIGQQQVGTRHLTPAQAQHSDRRLRHDTQRRRARDEQGGLGWVPLRQQRASQPVHPILPPTGFDAACHPLAVRALQGAQGLGKQRPRYDQARVVPHGIAS